LTCRKAGPESWPGKLARKAGPESWPGKLARKAGRAGIHADYDALTGAG
jgi:hypothetical protein